TAGAPAEAGSNKSRRGDLRYLQGIPQAELLALVKRLAQFLIHDGKPMGAPGGFHPRTARSRCSRSWSVACRSSSIHSAATVGSGGGGAGAGGGWAAGAPASTG